VTPPFPASGAPPEEEKGSHGPLPFGDTFGPLALLPRDERPDFFSGGVMWFFLLSLPPFRQRQERQYERHGASFLPFFFPPFSKIRLATPPPRIRCPFPKAKEFTSLFITPMQAIQASKRSPRNFSPLRIEDGQVRLLGSAGCGKSPPSFLFSRGG